MATIRVEELGAQVQADEWFCRGRGCDLGHGVASFGESSNGCRERTRNGGCWGDDACQVRDTFLKMLPSYVLSELMRPMRKGLFCASDSRSLRQVIG